MEIQPHQKKFREATGSAFKTITTPYETVAKTFLDFTVPRPPGSNINDNKRPRSVFEPVDEFNTTQPGEKFHRESSFTDEQRIYVGATSAALNMLAQGRLLGNTQNETQVPGFSQRIQTNFQKASPNNHFGDAIMESTLDLYTDFANHYANLTPALDALSQVAGIEGTAMVILGSYGALNNALTGELTEETIKQSGQYIVANENFVGLHPLDSDVKDYEIALPKHY